MEVSMRLIFVAALTWFIAPTASQEQVQSVCDIPTSQDVISAGEAFLSSLMPEGSQTMIMLQHMHFTCLATAALDKYSWASVVINFITDANPTPQVEQFQMRCESDVWGPDPLHFFGLTLPSMPFNIETKFQCSLCSEDSNSPNFDPDSNCQSCVPECLNLGGGFCTGSTAEDCCPYFNGDTGACVDDCAVIDPNFGPNEQFVCVCNISCEPGYILNTTDCSCELTDGCEAAGQPCRNGGTCISDLSALPYYYCQCNIGTSDQNCERTAMGTDFFVAAPPAQSSMPFNITHIVYIGTTHSNATYTIEDTLGMHLTTGNVNSSGPSTYYIPGNVGASDALVMTNEFSDRNKGLHIMSTGAESLFVLYTLGDNQYFSSYLAYPCADFEQGLYEYYAISFQPSLGDSSQVLLVGCEDETNITITPTVQVNLPLDAQTDSPLVLIENGTMSHTISLNQAETLLFTAAMDLTGTRIISNKPLTVISGNECGYVPVGFQSCEQLAVQVPPTLTWGMEFLLAPFAIRNSGQVYKIVAARDNTVISYMMSGSQGLNSALIPVAGNAYMLTTMADLFYYLSSDKPVFVAQFATGGSVESGGDGVGDPVMLIVPPTSAYIRNATFVTLDSRFTQHAISVTVMGDEELDLNDVLFDNEPFNCTWEPIEMIGDNVVGWGCTFTNLTNNTQHSVSRRDGGMLSVLSYGFGAMIGYGYLAGMRLQNLNSYDCVNLSAPSNGTVSLTSTAPGSVATYTCNDGYMLMGDATRKCQLNGTWSQQEPVCEIINCGSLLPPESGLVQFSMSTFGAMATYTCNTGFSLIGNGTRLCLANGSWEGVAPTCQVVDCMELLPPENGSVIFLNTTYLSLAMYECNEGFLLQGAHSRMCVDSGMWSEEEPQCQDLGDVSATVVVQFKALLMEEESRNPDQNQFEDILDTLEATILGFISGNNPGFTVVDCKTLDSRRRQAILEEMVTFECIVTVYEGAGMTETINTAQLIMILQIQISTLSIPSIMILPDSVIVGVGGICPAESTFSALYGNYNWPPFGGGNTYNTLCLYGSIGDLEGSGGDLSEFGAGLAQRVCNATGNWEDPNFSDCQSTLPLVTTNSGDTITVEIGGPVNIECIGSSVFNDVTVSWIQILDGEEKPVPLLPNLYNLTLEDSRRLYSSQHQPKIANLTNTSLALTSSAIEGMYICRGANQFGENSSNINIVVQRGEGDASSVYIRFSITMLSDSPSDQDITLAGIEYNIYNDFALASRVGVQTINCSVKGSNMNDSAATEDALSRVECVVREYPSQMTTLELGAQIATYIIESGESSPETVVFSEEGFCNYEVTMEEDGGVYEWEESVGNTKQTQPCLSTQGNATRNCLTGGLWTPVIYVECVMFITVPTPVEFVLYLRFSAELGAMLSTEFVTSTIEIEVGNAQLGVSLINCSSVLSGRDESNSSVRIECKIEGTTSSGNTEIVMESINEIVTENTFYIPGTNTSSELGFCEAESTSDVDRGDYAWEETEVGSSAQAPCAFGPSNEQATRECESRNSWGEAQILMCGTQVSLQFREFNETNVNITIENVEMVFNNLTEIVVVTTEPADQNADNIQIISSAIFETASLLNQSSSQGNIELAIIEVVAVDSVSIVDSVVEWPEEVVQEESTEIVQSFETIVDTLISQENFTEVRVIEDNVALIADQTPRNAFEGLTVSATGGNNKNLTAASGVDDQNILTEQQTAEITLPQGILDVIPEGEDVSIAVAVFDEATLFPVREVPTNEPPASDAVPVETIVGSQVISIQVAGVEDGTPLTAPIELVLSLNQIENMSEIDIMNTTCVFWDFTLADGRGNWNPAGCTLISFDNSTGVAECQCTHLTNFACLVDISARVDETVELTPILRDTLHYVGIIGSSLSLVGLFLTVLTFLIFKKLRARDASKFHIQLCLSLGAMFIVFIAGIDRTENGAGCVTVGVLIHYFSLVAWMWMGAEALLMFQKLIIVFGRTTYRYILLVSLLCWTVPVVPVVISVGINPDHYITEDKTINDSTSNSTTIPGYCYISNVWVFFFAFLAPIFFILIFNVIIFLLVLWTIIKHHRRKFKDSNKGHKMETLKTLVSLFGISFIFGTTWVFAIFTFISVNYNVYFAMLLIFSVCNTLQGFFIFFFFVILNSDARQAWKDLLCPCKKKKKALIITSTSNKHSTKSSAESSAGTLSSPLPYYQTNTLEKNVKKKEKEFHEMLYFNNPVAVEEDEEESSPDLIEPTLEAPSKEPVEQPLEVEETKMKGTVVRGRIQRRSTRRRTHDIETIELDFGLSSDESLDEEDI